MRKVQLHTYTLLILMGLTLLGAKAIKPLAEGKLVTDFHNIPMDFGDWSGVQGRFDDNTKRLLPSCSLLSRYYDRSDESAVELAVVYGTNLGDFHQPEQCLEGQGLRSVRKGTVQVKGADGKSFGANSVIMDSESEGRRAFVYWFSSRGTTATFLGNYKTKTFFTRMLSRKIEPSALVRLSTVISGGEDDEDAVRRVVDFADDVVPYLDKEFAEGASLVE